ncbi:MAG TPA: hypothetical protein VNC41_00555, partial [Acidimicrobiia bacterium]|nr:hypothetical protein [Acidimicrobiia bacterium]
MDQILALAEAQYGVFSRAQAIAHGLTIAALEHRVKRRSFEALFPGGYRVPAAPRTGRQRAMAATLWLGGDSAVSHLTSGTLLRLDSCKATELDLSVLRDVRRRVDGVRIHRVAQLPRIDRVSVDGIPCTSATRTLLDVASVLEEEALEVAFESARRMGLTSPSFLAKRAGDLGTRPGATAIKQLLGHQQPGERSLQY